MIGGRENKDSHLFLRDESKSAPLQKALEALTDAGGGLVHLGRGPTDTWRAYLVASDSGFSST